MPKKPNNISMYLKDEHVQKLNELRKLMAERSPSSTVRRMIDEQHYQLIARHQKQTKE